MLWSLPLPREESWGEGGRRSIFMQDLDLLCSTISLCTIPQKETIDSVNAAARENWRHRPTASPARPTGEALFLCQRDWRQISLSQ
jgi:hypothetical protein